ncbi:hypothetical protein ACX9EW_004084 [Escherichia coli]
MPQNSALQSWRVIARRWQWVRLSNRRMGLMKYYGMMDCGFCKKPSAAQNRWKNHLRTKGE